MLLSYKPRILLGVLLASLAFLPCLAVPIDPSQQPAAGPSTPEGKNTLPDQSAPAKGGRKASQEVTNFVADWMREKEIYFRAMESSTGGTEGWCQFDFEVECKKRNGLDFETSIGMRENKVYTKKQTAADWIFAPGNNHKGLIVELKVESTHQKGTILKSLIVKDQIKIAGKYKAEYAEYDKAVFAIAWTPESRREMENIEMIPVRGSGITMKSHPDHIITLYVWSGDLPTETASNLFSPDADPLENKGKGIAFHPSPNTQPPQTPIGQSPGGESPDQTPGNSQTPSKNPKEAVKNQPGKNKPDSRKGNSGGAAGSKSIV